MKVSEFIEWLKNQPQDAIVQVVTTNWISHELNAWWTDFNTEEYSNIVGNWLQLGSLDE